MEQRLANSWRMTVNEKKFVEDVVLLNLRVDCRLPFDYRNLTIELGREDGQAEVRLGHTRVMAYVTSQLVQPYRDRPNEGTLSIFTEFSPMADPSFEAGRPGELAIELGRVIDRGLRESRAVDMESLCVIAGRFVWAVRIDLHILDNGGNLIDAANTAALAALLTFRRPECAIGGDGQEVIIYPPEAREPLPLIVHHLPVAVTFAILNEGNNLTQLTMEEAVMGGRITVTMNSNGDVCAVQKAGGEGLMPSVIMQCLRIASVKAAEFTSEIEKTLEIGEVDQGSVDAFGCDVGFYIFVDAYNQGRIVRQIKRHVTSSAIEVNIPDISIEKNDADQLRYHTEKLKNGPDESCNSENSAIGVGTSSSQPRVSSARCGKAGAFVGGPSNWDPCSKGISSDFLRKFMALPGPTTVNKEEERINSVQELKESNLKKPAVDLGVNSLPIEAPNLRQKKTSPKSLKDAVKPKDRRKK